MVASGKDATKNDVPEEKKEELAVCMSELLQALLDTATSLNLDIIRSIHNKMALNAKKYPVELCKVSDYCDCIFVATDFISFHGAF